MNSLARKTCEPKTLGLLSFSSLIFKKEFSDWWSSSSLYKALIWCLYLQTEKVRQEQRNGAAPMETSEPSKRVTDGAERMDIDLSQKERCVPSAFACPLHSGTSCLLGVTHQCNSYSKLQSNACLISICSHILQFHSSRWMDKSRVEHELRFWFGAGPMCCSPRKRNSSSNPRRRSPMASTHSTRSMAKGKEEGRRSASESKFVIEYSYQILHLPQRDINISPYFVFNQLHYRLDSWALGEDHYIAVYL